MVAPIIFLWLATPTTRGKKEPWSVIPVVTTLHVPVFVIPLQLHSIWKNDSLC